LDMKRRAKEKINEHGATGIGGEMKRETEGKRQEREIRWERTY